MDLSDKVNRILMFFITWFGGIFGIHWFVQKDYKRGVLYLLSAGGLIVCWVYDTFKAFVNIFKYSPHIQEQLIFDNNSTQTKSNNSVNQKNKQFDLANLQLLSTNFDRMLTDVLCGYKNLDPYLSRYKLLLQMYSEMETIINKYNLSPFTYNSETLHEAFNTELDKFIKKKILMILDIHSIDKDTSALKKDLSKLRKDIIEGKHTYPEFSDLLQNIQFQIEHEINKL